MNNGIVKKMRKMYRKSIEKKATGKYGFEILRLARNRDILGIILILENIALIVLFFIFIFPILWGGGSFWILQNFITG